MYHFKFGEDWLDGAGTETKRQYDLGCQGDLDLKFMHTQGHRMTHYALRI